ncbi:hypothetical protein EK21DRAFT_105774 [Setomelanomma holmii]|uniref:Uncharacterized protein n=1 Tax=Setomelanomma holmii TaxID=210430 RepID=A0A9P4HKY9_9PLEO|nr:hypothetical protein EK21DRAFT_105774 [Setomelanomma holmii]
MADRESSLTRKTMDEITEDCANSPSTDSPSNPAPEPSNDSDWKTVGDPAAEDQEDAKEQASAPHVIDEEVYTQLYHHLLLALALHPSRPVVDLFAAGQNRLRQAYLEGQLSADGEILTHLLEPTMQENANYKAATEALLSNLINRIRAESAQNFLDTSSNIKVSASGYAREYLWKFAITPALVDKYRYFRQACNLDERSEVANPEDYEPLWDFLEETMAEQYDFDQWCHVSRLKPNMVLKQKLLANGETFEPSEGMIVGLYQYKVADTDKVSYQQDYIPEHKKVTKEGEEKKFYFLPHQDTVVVPAKSAKAGPRVYKKNLDHWVRKDGSTWKLFILIRVFVAGTDEYIEFHLLVDDKIKTVDPNDDDWRTSFNKWVRQFVRRKIKEVVQPRKHWTLEERVVVYKAINADVHVRGIDILASGKFPWGKAFFTPIAFQVNKVESRTRTYDAVQAFVRNQLYKQQKGAVFDLYERAKKIKALLDAGRDVPREERYPKEAIPLSADGVYGEDRAEDDEVEDEAAAGGISADAKEEEIEGGEDDITKDGVLSDAASIEDVKKRKRTDDDDGLDESVGGVESATADEHSARLTARASSPKKRKHTKEEETARQQAAKAAARAPPPMDDDDGDFADFA